MIYFIGFPAVIFKYADPLLAFTSHNQNCLHLNYIMYYNWGGDGFDCVSLLPPKDAKV
jgi:hypothetical protein